MAQQVSLLEKQRVLEAVRYEARLALAIALVRQQLDVLEMSRKIHSRVEGELNDARKEHYLRQQMRAIQRELGELKGGSGGAGGGGGLDSEGEEEEDEVAALEVALADAELPEAAGAIARRELKRLKRMAPQQPEHSVITTFVFRSLLAMTRHDFYFY